MVLLVKKKAERDFKPDVVLLCVGSGNKMPGLIFLILSTDTSALAAKG